MSRFDLRDISARLTRAPQGADLLGLRQGRARTEGQCCGEHRRRATSENYTSHEGLSFRYHGITHGPSRGGVTKPDSARAARLPRDDLPRVGAR